MDQTFIQLLMMTASQIYTRCATKTCNSNYCSFNSPRLCQQKIGLHTKIGLFNLICWLSLGHFVEHEFRSVIRLLSRPLNQPAYIDTVNINGRWLFSTSLCNFSCHFYSRLVFTECPHNYTRKYVTISWNCFNYYRQGFIRDN